MKKISIVMVLLACCTINVSASSVKVTSLKGWRGTSTTNSRKKETYSTHFNISFKKDGFVDSIKVNFYPLVSSKKINIGTGTVKEANSKEVPINNSGYFGADYRLYAEYNATNEFYGSKSCNGVINFR